MQRREFITLAGGAAATLLTTLATLAQEPGRIYRIGVLTVQPQTAAHYVAFLDGLSGRLRRGTQPRRRRTRLGTARRAISGNGGRAG